MGQTGVLLGRWVVLHSQSSELSIMHAGLSMPVAIQYVLLNINKKQINFKQIWGKYHYEFYESIV